MAKIQVNLSYFAEGLPDLEVASAVTFVNERNGTFDNVLVRLVPDEPDTALAAAPAAAPKPARASAKKGETTSPAPTPPAAEGADTEKAAETARAEAAQKALDAALKAKEQKAFDEAAAKAAAAGQPEADVLGDEAPSKTNADLVALLTRVVKTGPEGNAAVVKFVKQSLGYANARAVPLEECTAAFAKAEVELADFLKA